LRQISTEQDIASLPVPPQVGGRYSVLTAVGLLPLAVVGVDIAELLQGAAATVARCSGEQIEKNLALEMAALYYLLDINYNKRISVMMPYVNRLRLFVDWYCQLWAESLGKWDTRRPGVATGTLPVRAMGAVDQHSQLQMYLESRHDKMFTFLELAQWDYDLDIPMDASERQVFPYLEGKSLVDVIHAEFVATRQVITDTGHPNMTLHLPTLSAYTLGQLIELYQRTTVYTGLLYGINPLDQPSVEKGKKLAIQHLKDMTR
jgi:glucose-6-phosphate isomerase